jgi:hypothetical protein
MTQEDIVMLLEENKKSQALRQKEVDVIPITTK